MGTVNNARKIFDELYFLSGNVLPKRSDAVSKCIEAGINKATAQSTFAKWRREKVKEQDL